MTHVFFHWLPVGAALVLTFGFGYAIVQQEYRQSLNDPQIQIVRDAQFSLEKGEKQPKDIVHAFPAIDAEKSLAPFVVFYDESGNVLESSATLGGNAPKVPFGVLEYAKTHGEDRVTWQPNPSTRIALVVRPIAIESGWFVAAGRNMSEVESRIDTLINTTALALIVALVLSFIFDFVGDVWRRKAMGQMQK